MSITGVGEIASFATNIINKFFPDKTQEEKDALSLQLQELTVESGLLKGQMDVNQAEASAATGKLTGFGAFFVAGWRPGVGWSCALAFFWSYVAAPLFTYFSNLFGHPVSLPAIDISGMMPVLLGMLGLGTMRSAEKIKGVSTSH